MQIRLNDDEIRNVLMEALANKISYTPSERAALAPDEGWFEAKAGQIEDGEISDIHDVQFCYDLRIGDD